MLVVVFYEGLIKLRARSGSHTTRYLTATLNYSPIQSTDTVSLVHTTHVTLRE